MRQAGGFTLAATYVFFIHVRVGIPITRNGWSDFNRFSYSFCIIGLKFNQMSRILDVF